MRSRPIAAAAWLGLAALAFGCAAGFSPDRLPATEAGPPERVVFVSIQGLAADGLEASREGRVAMPNLRALASGGAFALQMASVAPASTYPAHATLQTGVPPVEHGIVADRRLGDHGVRSARYSHASRLRVATLWQRAAERGLPVASLDWPSTLGAAIPTLVPDAVSKRQQGWLESLHGAATPGLRARLEAHGGARPEAAQPGPVRDEVLVSLACELLTEATPPRLLLLRLGQLAPPLAAHGPATPQVRDAYASADRQLGRLLGCLDDAGRLGTSALVIVGDHGTAAVHTEIAPNAALAATGLLALTRGAVESWRAIARTNGGSAFVYARDERSAVRARLALAREADETGAFRIVGAEEMIGEGADPEAWFGLEAEPGFAFSDDPRGALLRASALRGVGGYLPERAGMDALFVGWGRGIRTGLRIPRMAQTDVAPTIANLLGFDLGAGRALVGLLDTERAPVATGAGR